MSASLAATLAKLQRQSLVDLRVRYAELFGEATRVGNRTWLVRRIGWRMQALAEGDLSERARQCAMELANDADLRLNPPRVKTVVPVPVPASKPVTASQSDGRLPLPGTVLTRKYKGKTLQVQVLANGFAFDGQVYRSLSAVARAITGSHCNGYLFFHLNRKAGNR